MAFVQAWSSDNLSVTYLDDHGAQTIFQAGSRAWRNCNPGNIRPGTFTDMHGAIGNAGAFAIFPDADTGFAAIVALLKTPFYQGRTVLEAFSVYAPADDNNDPVAYANIVSKQSGLPTAKILNTCTDQELTQMAQAIKVVEGWRPGTVVAPAQGAPAASMLAARTVVAQPTDSSYYTYEQESGCLYLTDSSGNDWVAHGYSGSKEGGGLNNPYAQCEKDIGPIPRSSYRIGPPFDGPSPISFPLDPMCPADLCGRSGFLIHGDSVAAPGTASHGCIILARPDRERIAASRVTLLKVVDRLAAAPVQVVAANAA